jgi:hypothetical protein
VRKRKKWVRGVLVVMKELREILLAAVIIFGMVVFGMFFYGLLEFGRACQGGDDGTVIGASCAK